MIQALLKRVLLALPLSIRRTVITLRERKWRSYAQAWERRNYAALPYVHPRGTCKKNVLVYHIAGLGHGGTEKNLQLIASALADEFNVFFMYGITAAEEERRNVMPASVQFVPFRYEDVEDKSPHCLRGMRPHLRAVIAERDIDLLVVAGAGYAHYPWNLVQGVPILLINVFGAPSVQPNIVSTVFVSQAVRDHAECWIGGSPRHRVLYSPLSSNPPPDVRTQGRLLRRRMGIPDDAFVFGRIGRASDEIFDPIAIRAWQKIAPTHADAYFLVMSPPPALLVILEQEKVPRVICIPPSGDEAAVWAFHGALDCFAHFRRDGETSGVAIAESLFVGNPVITHVSAIWNAHLGYLSSECASIAARDDIDEYARHMAGYVQLWRKDESAWNERRRAAEQVGKEHFSPDRYQQHIRELVRRL